MTWGRADSAASSGHVAALKAQLCWCSAHLGIATLSAWTTPSILLTRRTTVQSLEGTDPAAKNIVDSIRINHPDFKMIVDPLNGEDWHKDVELYERQLTPVGVFRNTRTR